MERTFTSHLLKPKFRLDVIVPVGNPLRTIQLSLSSDRINPFLLMANSGERRSSDTQVNNKIVRCQTYCGVCEFVRSLITPMVGSLYFCFRLCFPWSRLPDPLICCGSGLPTPAEVMGNAGYEPRSVVTAQSCSFILMPEAVPGSFTLVFTLQNFGQLFPAWRVHNKYNSYIKKPYSTAEMKL